MRRKGSSEGQIFHLRVQVACVNQFLGENVEMWSAIFVLLYAFVALSTALKINSSLLEGKVRRGSAYDISEIHVFRNSYVVSIRRQNQDTYKIEHVCLGCMITESKGILPWICKKLGSTHFVTTKEDEYKNEGLKPIKRFEKPVERQYYYWIDLFLMENPLWEPNKFPLLPSFDRTPCQLIGIMAVVSWNELVDNPKLEEQLLGIPIRPTNIVPETDRSFTIKSYPENFYEFGPEDLGGPVFFKDELIGILMPNFGAYKQVLRTLWGFESRPYEDAK